jgi:hypothetical protein
MVSAQLSLFDTATVIKPIYKVGDLVKLRKKPMAASYVKKGDIVVVDAIHPVDGSVKFWNERSERWEFVQQDEISITIPQAQVADTESIALPADDSVSSKAQVADTESIALPADDSVSSKAQVADTESIASPADDSVSSKAQVADTESIASPADDSVLKAISTYRPRGTARGGEYFRISYRDGTRMRHIHISGGNTGSPIAQAKVQKVRSLLAAGVPVIEIAELLKTKQLNN